VNRTNSSRPARASWLWLAPVLFCGSQAPAAPETGPVVEYDRAQNRFAVTTLDARALADFAGSRPAVADWNALFAVAVAGTETRVPMFGTYAVEGGALRFTPRFPLGPGEYVARLDPARLPGGSGPVVERRFRVAPPPPGPLSRVVAVYPSAAELPENLLRLYVHFSAPMRRGEAYDHVLILDAAGKAVEAPFLTLGEELWDLPGQRLTLLLDPGRVKHDLKPRQELGPILEAGKAYTLVIDGQWRDAAGQPLGKDFRQPFAAGAAEPRPVQPAGWALHPPPANTREPLVVASPKALDHALFGRTVQVLDAAGRAVAGDIAVTDHETRWRFTPQRPWAAGEYVLEVESILEDAAGNRVGRSFEVDELRPAPGTVPPARRSFTIAIKK
jgi:hypothetical protein